MSFALREFIWRKLAGDPTLVLAYHLIADDPPPHVRALFPVKTTSMFEADLRYAAAHHRFGTYFDVLEGSPGALVFTFDDGFREWLHTAQLLRKYGASAIFFVTSGWVGNHRMFYRHKAALCVERLRALWPEEWGAYRAHFESLAERALPRPEAAVAWLLEAPPCVADRIERACEALGVDWQEYLKTSRPYLEPDDLARLVRDGFVVGAHGVEHKSDLDADEDEQIAEIVASCEAVREWTGQDLVPFSFPHRWTHIRGARLDRLLADHPFIRGLFGQSRMPDAAEKLVPRVRADRPASSPGVSTLPTLLHRTYRGKAILRWDARFPLAVWRGAKRTWIRLRYGGRSRHCVLCGGRWRRFLPFGLRQRDEALCPGCLSLERHRLLWLYLQKKTDLFDGRPRKKLLHFAPEPALANRLREVPGLDYLSADLHMPEAMRRVDITAIPFPDNTFDVILASHVLQHVPADRRAMRELYRILKPGGWAVLTERIDGEATREDPDALTPEERQRAYGDPTYVRVYGRDFRERLMTAGFSVREDWFARTFRPDIVKRLGLAYPYPFYYCQKFTSS